MHPFDKLRASPATHAQVLAFIWRYMRRHTLLLVLLVSSLLAKTAIVLVKPFFYKEAVDAIAYADVGDRTVLRYALLMIVIGVVLGAVQLTIHEAASRLISWIELQVKRSVHMDVFSHIQHLSTSFHANTFAGSTARKLGRGTDAIEDMIDKIWFNFLPLLFLVVGFAIVLTAFSPIIGAVMIVGTLLYGYVSIILSLKLSTLQSWTDRQDTRVSGSMVDAITGSATVKAFAAEGWEVRRHGGVVEEWLRRIWKTWKRANWVTWTQLMMITMIEAALLLLGVWLWFRGDFTVGSFVVIVSYIGLLWGYLFDIGQQVKNYLRAAAHAQEMVGLYRTPLCVADRPDAELLEIPRGAIHFGNVTFAYEKNVQPIFRKFSVDIEAGEKIALVGHSGGGKTTFVKLLQRLYDLDSGKITIDGQDIAQVTQGSLRTAIGLMPQDPMLFHRSIAENIGYGKPDASQKEIEKVAKLAHAHTFISKLPKGYETLVGERGVKLSGGERQRVAIARAILADTPILILDEATSSLDSLSEQYIQEALEYLMKDRTTIVIAHRLSTIKKVDRILVIEDGKIVEEGSHSALVRKKNGVYRGFYELQAGGFIGE